MKLSSPHRTSFAMKSAISAELLPSLRCILERLKSKEKIEKNILPVAVAKDTGRKIQCFFSFTLRLPVAGWRSNPAYYFSCLFKTFLNFQQRVNCQIRELLKKPFCNEMKNGSKYASFEKTRIKTGNSISVDCFKPSVKNCKAS